MTVIQVDNVVNQNHYGYDEVPVIEIQIDEITNKLSGFDDSENQYTVVVESNSVASGSGLAIIAGQKFRVPFVRTDTGRRVPMIAEVDSEGRFNITLDFKSQGDWITNSELLNSELPDDAPQFLIPQYKFKVV